MATQRLKENNEGYLQLIYPDPGVQIMGSSKNRHANEKYREREKTRRGQSPRRHILSHLSLLRAAPN